MKKLVFSIVLLLPVLAGCEFLHPDRKIPQTDGVSRVVVDPRVLAGCDKIPELQGDIDFDKLAEHYIGLVRLYGICSAKQRMSIQAIRELANLPVDFKE